MMDTLKEKILNEYSRQCYYIINTSHALDLLETFEVLGLNDEEHTQQTAVKDRILEYLSDHLKGSIKGLKSLLKGRNISLKFQLYLKALAMEMVLDNLQDRTADQKYKKEAQLFIHDLYKLRD